MRIPHALWLSLFAASWLGCSTASKPPIQQAWEEAEQECDDPGKDQCVTLFCLEDTCGFYRCEDTPVEVELARFPQSQDLARWFDKQGVKIHHYTMPIPRDLHYRIHNLSEKRVARLMRQEGLAARKRRPFVRTTDSQHPHPVAPNVVARDFLPPGPNRTWAGDITYVWTSEGWLYLAVVLDLFSRRVVGWSMSERIDRQLVLAALDMALAGRAAPDLYHSDRGSQYASEDYRERLAEHGITCTMSRKGNCWDNAVVERFFSSLKMELVHTRRFRTHDEATLALFEYIEVFYNRKRRHSSLGYVSAAEYERTTEVPRQAA